VATAPPEDQRRLLDVQALDTRTQQLAHQRRNLPALAKLTELDGRIADLRASLVESRTRVADLKRELVKAETDVEQVRNRATRDQQRLDSGGVSAKDAVALTDELGSLATRQAALEEIELDVMERLEAHEEALAQVEAATTSSSRRRRRSRPSATRAGPRSTPSSRRSSASGRRPPTGSTPPWSSCTRRSGRSSAAPAPQCSTATAARAAVWTSRRATSRRSRARRPTP
jgi:hypothetical protein